MLLSSFSRPCHSQLSHWHGLLDVSPSVIFCTFPFCAFSALVKIRQASAIRALTGRYYPAGIEPFPQVADVVEFVLEAAAEGVAEDDPEFPQVADVVEFVFSTMPFAVIALARPVGRFAFLRCHDSPFLLVLGSPMNHCLQMFPYVPFIKFF